MFNMFNTCCPKSLITLCLLLQMPAPADWFRSVTALRGRECLWGHLIKQIQAVEMTRGQNNEAHHGFVGIISVGVVVVRSVGKWQFWMFQVTRSGAWLPDGR